MCWKEENEYRYVFKYLKTSKYFASNEGLLLKGIKPHHIFIGYRINKEYRERLITYCKKNDICLYEVKRNNKTKDNRGYYKRVIVSKRNKKDKEGNIYTTLLKWGIVNVKNSIH